MAGDWTKMRVWLRKDPKVIRMGEFLAADPRFARWISTPETPCDSERDRNVTSCDSHVTRRVTLSVTVSSLLEIWGVARDRGKRDGDDLVMEYCTLDALDEICGTPSIGRAMRKAKWAKEEVLLTEDGPESLVRFPRFFEENVSPEERFREKNRERQARYRASKRNVTRNVTGDASVTHREEKRREELCVSKDTHSQIDWSAELASWNSIAESCGLKKAAKIDGARRERLAVRFREAGSSSELWNRVRASCELLGPFAKEQGFVTIDFVSKPESLTKLLEGNYSNKKNTSRISSPVNGSRRSSFNPPNKFEESPP